MAMGQKPVPPVNILIPTKIGSRMGGAPTNQNRIPLALTTTAHIIIIHYIRAFGGVSNGARLPAVHPALDAFARPQRRSRSGRSKDGDLGLAVGDTGPLQTAGLAGLPSVFPAKSLTFSGSNENYH